MNIGTVTYRVPGGVRLIRSAEKMSAQDISKRLKEAQNDGIIRFNGCEYCDIPLNTKNHDVNLEERDCFIETSITKDQYNAITRATYKKNRWTGPYPSRTALKEAGMNVLQYLRSPEYTKLMVFFSDNAADLGAIDFKITLFPV